MIVVSDVDGTLIDPGATEGYHCRRFFKRLAAGGSVCGLASSRSLPSLLAAVPYALAHSRFAICSDGALTYWRMSKASDLVTVRRATLAESSEVLACLRRVPIAAPTSLFVFMDDRKDLCVFGDIKAVHESLMPRVLQGRPLNRLEKWPAADGVLSVGLLSSRAQVVLAANLLAEATVDVNVRIFPEHRLPDSGLWWCEVTSYAADKRHALEFLLNTGHIDKAKVPLVLLGDGLNDIPLAHICDRVICPSWGASTLLRLATTVVHALGSESFVKEVDERLEELVTGD